MSLMGCVGGAADQEVVGVGGGDDLQLGFSNEPGFGFKAGALPLSHVAYVGSVLSVAAAGAVVVPRLVGHGIDAQLG